MAIPTPHISAKAGDFADTVLMPGDPLRSKLVAEKYLENAVLVNDVRGVQGYTGTYKGKRVSVMASGMGQPSIGIYSYELFKFYDVKTIIRIGSCGAYAEGVHMYDVVLAQGACTNGNYAGQYELPGTYAPIANFDLLRKTAEYCEESNIRYHVGNVLSTDVFYNEDEHVDKWTKMGVLGVEMEAASLYCNAARLGKRALAICTVSDSFVYPEEKTTSEDRRARFTQMIEIALEMA